MLNVFIHVFHHEKIPHEHTEKNISVGGFKQMLISLVKERQTLVLASMKTPRMPFSTTAALEETWILWTVSTFIHFVISL